MLRILFDTNVVLDVLLEREPFVKAASLVMDANVRGDINGLLGATTVTTLFYLLSSAQDADTARGHMTELLQHFEVAPVQRRVLENAAQSDFSDSTDPCTGRRRKFSSDGGRAFISSEFVSRNPFTYQ